MTNNDPVLETERLRARPATTADVPLFAALWNDPRVMRFVGFPHGLRQTDEEIAAQLARMAATGFQPLLVIILKETGQAIGHAKLARPDEAGIAEPDIKLLPAFWRQGYGRELYQALVAWHFTHTDCTAVQATPNVDNIASIKLQEGAGARRVGQSVYHFPESMRSFTTPVPHYIYRIERAAWESG